MKVLHISFYILLVVLLRLTIHAELTGSVAFRHTHADDEIWITDINDTRNARLLFKHKNTIRRLSVQENSRYIATVVANEDDANKDEIYIVDISREDAFIVQIQEKFKYFYRIDISQNGDIIFTIDPRPGFRGQEGVYLIRRAEIRKQNPKILLLKEVLGIENVVWAPNGKQIAYDAIRGVFILDVGTRNETLISRAGRLPVFSPDGKKLAFLNSNGELDIISLDTLQLLSTIKDIFVDRIGIFIGGRLRWTPDGEYLIFRNWVTPRFQRRGVSRNIAIPVNGGPFESILEIDNKAISEYDWINPAYPVEPANRLTTLWSSMKQ